MRPQQTTFSLFLFLFLLFSFHSSFYLPDNLIGAEGAKALAGALETNTTLTFLSLGGDVPRLACTYLRLSFIMDWTSVNFIGPEGGKAFGEVLKTNTTLNALFLKTMRGRRLFFSFFRCHILQLQPISSGTMAQSQSLRR